MKTLLLLLAFAMLQAPDAVKTIDKGDQSNVEGAKQVTVRTEAEWNALWTQHGGDRKRPVVNFAKDMVVGVFMGSRSTAGYTIAILSTIERDGKLLVRYQQTAPAKGMMTAQIITSPYHLVSAPRTAGSVTFQKVESEK